MLFQQQQQPNINITIPKQQIAKLCAHCERWVGTEGGGMDQAISVFAQQGSGRCVQFQPTFQQKAIPLPNNASWVATHSLEESHKRQTATMNFNERVVECKVGCWWLATRVLGANNNREQQTNPPTLLWELVRQSDRSLEELERIVLEKVPETCDKAELFALVGGEPPTATDDSQKLKQVASKLGITRQAGLEVLKVADSFCIRDRLLHVFSETRRVQEFVATCCGESHSAATGGGETMMLQALGSLLNQSHSSCSKLCDCSSPQVDRLQQVCAKAPGAVGSRVTGAGWGGCVISLVQCQHIEAFCAHVRKECYASLPSNETSNNNEADYMFVTKPSQGSNMFDCSGG